MIIATSVLAFGFTGAGVSLAEGPGPNGHNTYGLCNAYGHNGGGNSHAARPFADLERQAREADEADGNDDYTTTAEEVGAFCDDNGQKPGKGGGNGG